MKESNNHKDHQDFLPNGFPYLNFLFSKDDEKAAKIEELFNIDKEFESARTLKAVSEFLRITYKVATCAYGCHGGVHIIEYLTARGHNLGAAAFKLLTVGYYDESLSLIRSISEIVNLFALFAVEEASLEKWFSLSEKDRIKQYSPAIVRKKLEKHPLQVPISKEYYSKLCEVAVHVNPNTKPQGRNHLNRNLVGGFVVREQAIAVLNDLAINLSWLTIFCLRNSVPREIFIEETESINHILNDYGAISIMNIEEFFNKHENGS